MLPFRACAEGRFARGMGEQMRGHRYLIEMDKGLDAADARDAWKCRAHGRADKGAEHQFAAGGDSIHCTKVTIVLVCRRVES